MAYIESHQELGHHPKTKKAARLLGISIPQLVGHLQFLWWWAMDYAQNGDITDHDPQDIAEAIYWEGEAQTFLNALLACGIGKGAGFLEITEEGRIVIHDWMHYCGKLIDARKKDAERKRQARLGVTSGTTDRHHEDIPPSSDGHPTDNEKTADVPYLTVPNRTPPDLALTSDIVESMAMNGAAAPSSQAQASILVNEIPPTQLSARHQNATKTPPKPRAPDLLFEAMLAEYPDPTAKLTSSERGRINTALKQLREVGATPEDIRLRARIYKRKWPDKDFTATGLCGNWSHLTTVTPEYSTTNQARASPPPRFKPPSPPKPFVPKNQVKEAL